MQSNNGDTEHMEAPEKTMMDRSGSRSKNHKAMRLNESKVKNPIPPVSHNDDNRKLTSAKAVTNPGPWSSSDPVKSLERSPSSSLSPSPESLPDSSMSLSASVYMDLRLLLVLDVGLDPSVPYWWRNLEGVGLGGDREELMSGSGVDPLLISDVDVDVETVVVVGIDSEGALDVTARSSSWLPLRFDDFLDECPRLCLPDDGTWLP